MLDAHVAQRKANGWLVTHVGSVMAQHPQLQQVEERLIWRFQAFLTTRSRSPRGPVGAVDVDAYTGEVHTDESAAADMIANARTIVGSRPSTRH